MPVPGPIGPVKNSEVIGGGPADLVPGDRPFAGDLTVRPLLETALTGSPLWALVPVTASRQREPERPQNG